MTDELVSGAGAGPLRRALTVVIPVHGPAPKLARTLASLADARVPELRCVRVVENGGRGPVEAICRPFADRLPLVFTSIPEAGRNRAFQSALPAVGNDLIVFLDDDIRLAPDALRVYAERALPLGPGHYFGGTVEVDYETPPHPWLLRYLPLSVRGFRPAAGETAFLGANSAAFAEDVRRVGGFDPAFGPGAFRAGSEGNPTGSETRLQQQLRAIGVVPVPLPEAVIWHWVPAERCTPAWGLHRARRTGMSQALALPPEARQWAGVPPWILRGLVASLPGLALSLFGASVQRRFERRRRFELLYGWVQGARMRRRIRARRG